MIWFYSNAGLVTFDLPTRLSPPRGHGSPARTAPKAGAETNMSYALIERNTYFTIQLSLARIAQPCLQLGMLGFDRLVRWLLRDLIKIDRKNVPAGATSPPTLPCPPIHTSAARGTGATLCSAA